MNTTPSIIAQRALSTLNISCHLSILPSTVPRARISISPSSSITPTSLLRNFHRSSKRLGVPLPGEDPGQTGVRSAAGTATMAPPAAESSAPKPKPRSKPGSSVPAKPRPSASIIVVSPDNSILLLHRVQTSSAFPSAHVFPGGNLSASDGALPPLSSTSHHQDNTTYRTGAIRELFEESGILLARSSPTSSRLLPVSASARSAGRKAIHSRKIQFSDWLSQVPSTSSSDGSISSSPDSSSSSSSGPVLDLASLQPFSHWVTPPNVPKRFTTQMYLYFTPLSERGSPSIVPTSDEIENTAAEWARASVWLERARRGEVILFPPQFLLLWIVSRFLDSSSSNLPSESNGSGNASRDINVIVKEEKGEENDETILARRARLLEFINTAPSHSSSSSSSSSLSSPAWRDKFISPISLGVRAHDGKAILGLDKPGPELKDSGLAGDADHVVLVKFSKEGPREVEVRSRKEVLAEVREELRRKEKDKSQKEEEEGGAAVAAAAVGKRGSKI